jgi:demethylspheroidene O-methyltransferase
VPIRLRWLKWRNSVLGSARFQAWASRTPIIRRIARAKAAAQFDLVAGFVYSQILAAAVESGLLETVQAGPTSGQALPQAMGLGEDAACRLIYAAAALNLIEDAGDGVWVLGAEGAALMANPGVLAMVRHHHLLYQDLADPMALLRANRQDETRLSAFWTYAAKDITKGDAADYSALMAATQPMVAQQIVDAYNFAQHRRMLDIGGGSGAFISAIAAAAPQIELGIFDLPDVIAAAQARFDAPNRAGTAMPMLHAGSFKSDPIPAGYDLITLVRIAHDHDDAVVQALFAAIRAALPPGGRLLIIEPMANAPSGKRMGNAYFGFYLWAMRSGRPRSADAYRIMLHQAGFASVKSVKTGLPIITSAIVAQA